MAKEEMKTKTRSQGKKVRSKRNARTYRKRGGGDLTDACKKYRLKGTLPGNPDPSFTTPISQSNFELLQSTIESVPDDSILLLKVGANDSTTEGSKGKKGHFFVEMPFSNTGVTSLKPLPNTTIIDSICVSLGIISRNNENEGGATIFSLAIDPEDPSPYPFINEPKNQNQVTQNLSAITGSIKGNLNLKGYFPIGNSEGTDKTILDMIVNHPQPLILFNAMGSYCYRSFKYILDNRKRQGRQSIYMGLVDTLAMAACDINDMIYPDPGTTCATHNTTLKNRANSEAKRVAALQASDPKALLLEKIKELYNYKYARSTAVMRRAMDTTMTLLEKGSMSPEMTMQRLRAL